MADEKTLVELEKKEFDVVNDGKGLRMKVALMASKTYSKEGLIALKEKLTAELEECGLLLAKMDELKVE